MKLSAVVCTHERYDLLATAIRSLACQSGVQGRLDVLVVDNSPDPAAAAAFAGRFGHLEPIRFLHSTTPGLSRARNLGLAAATGDVVAYIDDDAVAHPRWAASLLQAFEHFGAECGIAGGPVRPIWEVAPPFPMTAPFRDVYSIVERGDTLRVMEEGEWLAGCNIAFDRTALLEAGGFELGLGRIGNAAALLSNEETVACGKIKKAGKTMVFAPDAAVEHLIPAERCTVEWLVRRVAWQTVSDAISQPEAARDHARWLAAEQRPRKRLKRALAWFRFWRRYRQGLRDEDFGLIYDTLNEFLCIGL